MGFARAQPILRTALVAAIVTVSTDIAKRVYDHTFKLDPIVRSLLDTDFYKLMMLQMIWGLYRDVEVTFSLINRTARVRVAEEIDEQQLRDQLDHARTLRFTKKEMIWLAGNSFYGRAHIFDAKFLAWLADFQLPEYELTRADGQYELHFKGPWTHTTMWEIPALAIINELRSRAALARDDEEVRRAPCQVLREWKRYYAGNLLIVLPDAFGTTAFLRDAPDWIADWTGFRPDSAPPVPGGEEIIAWWKHKGRDPRDKLLVFSDALDADTIESTYRHFDGKARMSFGWGTNLTNDFDGCAPQPDDGLRAISLVCKVTAANGRPAVKLSDNPHKATGTPEEIARYLRVFGGEGRLEREVVV